MPRITITQNYVNNLKSAIEDCHSKRSYTYYKCLIFESKKADSLKILKKLSDYIFYLGWLDVTVDSTDYVQCIKDTALDSCSINEEELLSEAVIFPILYEDGTVVLTEQFSYYLQQENS